MAQPNKSKKVADESSIENDIPEAKSVSQEDLIARVVGSTTAKVMEQMLPFLQSGQKTKTEEEIRSTVKNVKERTVREMNTEFDRVVSENRAFMKRLADAPKSDYRTIVIPKVYRKYIGSQLPVGINGSFINVPVDGRAYRVPKDYYSLIKRRLEYEDDKIDTMERTDFKDVMEVDDPNTLGQ